MSKKLTKKFYKKLVIGFLFIFLLMNVVALFHAYKFTHFTHDTVVKTKNPSQLSTWKKIRTLLLGVDNPRPRNTKTPTQPYRVVSVDGSRKLEAWLMPTDSAKGTVILFHGYSGAKSQMLDRAAVFWNLGYQTMLVDFRGSGGSEGDQTTIGYDEAEDVTACMNALTQQGEKNIYLFGTSMGAVAILKALHDSPLQPAGIILECPFGSMYQTTCSRFDQMHAPRFPMAGLLVFWGGLQNGYWAFRHNPTTYAQAVTCPTLLLYGQKDRHVSQQETDEIFANLKGKKTLKCYPEVGHENFLKKAPIQWTHDVTAFLSELGLHR